MKKIAIVLIQIYQIVIVPFIKQVLGIKSECRYAPSCSEYTIAAIRRYGVIKGIFKSSKRLATCQPFGNTYGTNI